MGKRKGSRGKKIPLGFGCDILPEDEPDFQDVDHLLHQISEQQVEQGDQTCSICMETIPFRESAETQCNHVFCVLCILRWYQHKSCTTCPMCKEDGDLLKVFRDIDGTLYNSADWESIALLRNSHWFQGFIKDLESGQLFQYPLYRQCDYEDIYDQEFNAIYEDFSLLGVTPNNGSGSRVKLHNRPFGKGGYIYSGRATARRQQQAQTSSKGKGKSNSIEAIDSDQIGDSTQDDRAGTSSSGKGRRAQRRQRRLEQYQEETVCECDNDLARPCSELANTVVATNIQVTERN